MTDERSHGHDASPGLARRDFTSVGIVLGADAVQVALKILDFAAQLGNDHRELLNIRGTARARQVQRVAAEQGAGVHCDIQ